MGWDRRGPVAKGKVVGVTEACGEDAGRWQSSGAEAASQASESGPIPGTHSQCDFGQVSGPIHSSVSKASRQHIPVG